MSKASSHPHSFRGGIKGKECAHCREWKPLIHYPVKTAAPDGLDYDCRPCIVNRPSHKRATAKAKAKRLAAHPSQVMSRRGHKGSSKGYFDTRILPVDNYG